MPDKKKNINKEEKNPYQGSAIVDIVDDSLYIEAGNEDSNITRLGRKSSSFKPYMFKIDGINYFSVYSFTIEDLPSNYKETIDFLFDLEQQKDNEFIDNYIRLGANEMNEFLKSKHLYKDVYFVKIDSKNQVLEKFFQLLVKDTSNVILDGIEKIEELSPEELIVAQDVPDEVKEFLNAQLSTLTRVDRDYSLTDSGITEELMKYLDGKININNQSFSNIPDNASIFTVTDYVSSNSLVVEFARYLKAKNINLLGNISLLQAL